ncbi:MAG: hypothetical protein ACTTI6_10515 [Treponema sp.]|uniref:PBECR3 domain-containing polyvalent protein n=1 Tax=Treponema sp. TaxID=166 RepID=UPI003FA2B259
MKIVFQQNTLDAIQKSRFFIHNTADSILKAASPQGGLNTAGTKDDKFRYFQKKIIEQLAQLEGEESQELKKSLFYMVDTIVKSKFPVGTIREWKGKKYIKIAPGKWRAKYDSHSRSAKLAVAALKRKAEQCKTSQELLQLVLENRDRFSDKDGRPLPFVQELRRYVSELNDKIENQAAEQPKAKVSERPEGADAGNISKKKGRLPVLNKAELHDFIEKHKTSTENVRVSLGEISSKAQQRIKEKTGLVVNRVILDSDSIRHAYGKEAHNLEPNDLDNMFDVINTTNDITVSSKKYNNNTAIIFKEEIENGVFFVEEFRAGKNELELVTAYRQKKNRRPQHNVIENDPGNNVQNGTVPTSTIPQPEGKSSGGIADKMEQWKKEGRKIVKDDRGLYFKA